KARPLGALSVTPPRPPCTKCRESIAPSDVSRLMNPLPSLADGEPLMLLTNQTRCSLSYSADSGVENPSTVATRSGAAGAAGVLSRAGAFPPPPQAERT